MKPVKSLSILIATFLLIGVSNEASAESFTNCSLDSKGDESCLYYSTNNSNQFKFDVTTKYKTPVKNFGAVRGIFPVKIHVYSANSSCSPRKTTVTDVKLNDAYGRPISLQPGTYSNLKFSVKSAAEIITRALCKKFTNG
jgi:hypothetical protein